MNYRDVEYDVIQIKEGGPWKWTASIGKALTISGTAINKPVAVAEAIRAIDRALTPR